jgi:peptide/nickel transport system ATP-binding protein
VFRGCRFVERCDLAQASCRVHAPDWSVLSGSRGVSCHLWAEGREPGAEGFRQGSRGGEDVAGSPPATAVPVGESAAQRILQIRDLAVHFPIQSGIFKRVVGQVRAVDGLTLDLHAGRTLALVGESGCGKTTAGRAILQLIRPTGGSVRYRDREIAGLGDRRMRPFRRDLQIIFQDPYSAMNPRMLVGDIVGEGLAALGLERTRAGRLRRVAGLLELVGIDPEAVDRYPHEFSGGQRQRICIARALAVEPKLIVCDEPTSALDVSVQAQILNLLKDLQQRLGLSYLFITHDLSVVAYLAHEVAVMYLGRVVERGRVDEILDDPRHPYTRALLSAVPVIDPGQRRSIIRLDGDMPSPSAPPPGCHFHPRCPEALPQCVTAYPAETRSSATRIVHCVRA